MSSTSESFLLERYREIALLESVQGVLHWDMETKMPKQGTDLRGRQLGLMASLIHGKETESRYVEEALKLQNSPHARPLRRRLLNTLCVDTAFVARLSEAQVQCQNLWKKARQAKDFSIVSPALQGLVDLQREWAQRYKAHPAATPEVKSLSNFEACLGLFEPGFPAQKLDALLNELGPALKTRVPSVVAKQGAARDTLTLAMPIEEQQILVQRVCKDLGFDFNHGRLDESAHPFCGGSPEDTRLTVRYDERDFTNAVTSTTHETGHAIYEQNLPAELLYTPVGVAASYGVHESQSRFLENQIGRSQPFANYLAKITGRDAGLLYSHLNRVKNSFIRVDADEVTYNLHIMIRVGIEKKLLNGEMNADEIPAAWNAAYADYLGLKVPDDGVGCLQDIHWYGGSFGYFATYTLGNLIAAALFQDFQKLNPIWEAQVSSGDFSAIRNFCKDRVHRHAALHDSPGTIQLALGRELTAKPFLEYVDHKYLGK